MYITRRFVLTRQLARPRSEATPRPRLDGCKIKTKTNEIQIAIKRLNSNKAARPDSLREGGASLQIWKSSLQRAAASVRPSTELHVGPNFQTRPDPQSSQSVLPYWPGVCLQGRLYLYGCKAWTLYRRYIKAPEDFHTRCLQIILGIDGGRKCRTYTDISSWAEITRIEHLLAQIKLSWLGHLIRMPDNRLLGLQLYGELSPGQTTEMVS